MIYIIAISIIGIFLLLTQYHIDALNKLHENFIKFKDINNKYINLLKRQLERHNHYIKSAHYDLTKLVEAYNKAIQDTSSKSVDIYNLIAKTGVFLKDLENICKDWEEKVKDDEKRI